MVGICNFGKSQAKLSNHHRNSVWQNTGGKQKYLIKISLSSQGGTAVPSDLGG